MVAFANPQLLWLLTLLPVFAIWRARRGPRAAVRYATTDLVREVGTTTRSRAGRLPGEPRVCSQTSSNLGLE